MSVSTAPPRNLNSRHQEKACPLDFADLLRLEADSQLNAVRQVELGQFFSDANVARFMAGIFQVPISPLHLLDAGAGIGSLSAAFVSEICRRESRPRSVKITAYETDGELIPYLQKTLRACRDQCDTAEIAFESHIINADFITAGVALLGGGARKDRESFDCAILNPPYRKIRSDSDWRLALAAVGVETGNLYTAFLWLAMRLLKPGGELVAITPRSFCNGPYFKPFRVAFTDLMNLRRFHIFESRVEAFRANAVLQENIIFHADKKMGGAKTDKTVIISSSLGPQEASVTWRVVPHAQVIRPSDPNIFINIVPDAWGQSIAQQMATLPSSLEDLGLSISTGRVVDFRAKDYLRAAPCEPSPELVAPLIYPLNFVNSFIKWPVASAKKPAAIAVVPATLALLNAAGIYVLVKRFTSKEQRRRIVAAIYDPTRVKLNGNGPSSVGFENHLNYFHEAGSGLTRELATGLAAFLNSTLVDEFFRQFNGHTQVNATDLRSLKYPSRSALATLGQRIIEEYGAAVPTQVQVDALLAEEILPMSTDETALDPIQIKQRIDESLSILKALKLNRQQQNERSALTVLALLGLTPATAWHKAQNPLCGITPMMDFFREHYGKNYAPNTRETVRRQTVHQFMQAGLIVANPDDPQRPVNSAKTVYQVTPETLAMMRVYGTPEWDNSLAAFMAAQEAIKARGLRARAMHRIPVTLPNGENFTLSPGGQNLLIKEVLEQFCPRYTPGGKILYVGDADEKLAFHDAAYLAKLGITVDEHGKMPDVVVHHTEKNWLVLIEAVTSHGPVDLKRHLELKALFAGSNAGLVFVTTFFDRAAMSKYIRDIAWETEVWIADAPNHLIHFNGERFLGPYGL